MKANCVFFHVSRLLREQWIRAKYERNEFEFIEKQEPYSAGTCLLTRLNYYTCDDLCFWGGGLKLELMFFISTSV